MSDITSKNSKLIFSSTVLATPLIFEEFWTDTILETDDVENIDTKIGIDGKIYTSVKAVIHTGSINFSPSSASLSAIRNIIATQTSSNKVVMGKMIVLLPNSGNSWVLEDFHFNSAISIPNLADSLKEVKVKFSSQLPTMQNVPNFDIKDLASALSNINSAVDITKKINNVFDI